MHALNSLTANINVFVRFFQSINHLFCQIRWLDSNIRNSSGSLLAAVGAIVFICYLVYTQPEERILKILTDQGPLLIVCVVIAVLVYRRYHLGATGDSNVNSILFGNPESEPKERDVEIGRGARVVQAGSVRYI